jgi:mRNA interferase RelE/StbE
MKIKYTKQATKTLKAYDKNTRDLIRSKIYGLTKTPPEGDIKPLQGSKTEKRLRVGKYRVIYEYLTETQEEIKIKILMINKIDSRGDIYK